MDLIHLHGGQAVDVYLNIVSFRKRQGVVGLTPGPAASEHGAAFNKDDLPWQEGVQFL